MAIWDMAKDIGMITTLPDRRRMAVTKGATKAIRASSTGRQRLIRIGGTITDTAATAGAGTIATHGDIEILIGSHIVPGER
jgi:hypothetical protein